MATKTGTENPGNCDWCKQPVLARTYRRNWKYYKTILEDAVFEVCEPCVKQSNRLALQTFDIYPFDNEALDPFEPGDDEIIIQKKLD